MGWEGWLKGRLEEVVQVIVGALIFLLAQLAQDEVGVGIKGGIRVKGPCFTCKLL